jgi:hypothetical protein
VDLLLGQQLHQLPHARFTPDGDATEALNIKK